MNKRRIVKSFGWFVFVALPSLSSAQSSISGVVRDTSGAVMPGVTVEAASPALIERSRAVTTDGSGRYTIVDLRPGEYTLTATAPGFKTYRQARIDVPANVSVPVYVEMTVGATGESVTIQAESSTVDVDTAATPRVLTREVMDTIPSARNMQQLGGLMPGIRLTTPDVGGSQQMEQTYFTGRGSPSSHTTVLLDGMNINSNFIDGQIQNYVDNAIIAQSTYQTAAVSAEVSAGGVLVNQVPKDGGNTFHGDVFIGGSGGSNFWQGSNVTPDLVTRGLVGQSKVKFIKDYDGSVGGPLLHDKLWFLAAARYQSTYTIIPNSFYPDGSPGIEDQYIKSGTFRLSWQITSKDKFSGTYERNQKFRGHSLAAAVGGRPDNPAVSALRRGPPLYYVAQGKWTRAQSAKLLFEAGFSTDIIHYSDIYQPGQAKEPFTPEWYALASHIDAVTNIRSVSGGLNSYFLPDRRSINGAVSYVTGSHNFKAGIQQAWGKNDRVSSINGDLEQRYQSGIPFQVWVYNTPIAVRQGVNWDLAIFAQDTWHIQRLSVTGGLRFEYEKSTINPSGIGAGRFVPARSFPKINCETHPGLGCWKTWSPRLGLAYDLFGNGKTSVKASFGRYSSPNATLYLTALNPMATSIDPRNWTDCPAGTPYLGCTAGGTNHDGIAQDSEIGPSTNANFGKLANVPTIDPNYKREYNLQYTVGIQHQIAPRLAVNFNWFRRTNYDGTYIRNRALDPVADWTPFTVTNPLDGELITAYNISSTASKRAADLFQTNTDQSLVRNTYTGYDFGVTGRLPHGANVFGTWTIDRVTDMQCDLSLVGSSVQNDPNNRRFCDQRGLIPFRNEFKLAGNLPLWWKFEASMSWQSDPEPLKFVNWTISNSTLYPAGCNCGALAGTKVVVGPALTNPSLTIPLVAPGTRFRDRLNQFDVGLRRTFVIRESMRLQFQADVFNVNNSHAVLSETTTLNAAPTAISRYSTLDFLKDGGLGGQPQTILQPRLMRLALQFHF
jgi:Carboxypeptidase regulatory-like domain/TonB-dependent Receptor Plug Domain